MAKKQWNDAERRDNAAQALKVFSGQLDGAAFAYRLKFDAEKAADIQAKYRALHFVYEEQPEEIRATLKPLGQIFPDQIDDILTKFGKSEEKRAQLYKVARAMVDMRQGMPEGVPKFGECAVKGKLIDRNDMNAFFTAQAAAKTLKMMNELEAGEASRKRLQQSIDDSLFTNVGKFKNDPDELKSAQAVNHLASIYAAIVDEGSTDARFIPTLRNEVREALQYAENYFRAAGYEKAADDLQCLHQETKAQVAKAASVPSMNDFATDMEAIFDRDMAVVRSRLALAGITRSARTFDAMAATPRRPVLEA